MDTTKCRTCGREYDADERQVVSDLFKAIGGDLIIEIVTQRAIMFSPIQAHDEIRRGAVEHREDLLDSFVDTNDERNPCSHVCVQCFHRNNTEQPLQEFLQTLLDQPWENPGLFEFQEMKPAGSSDDS